MLVRIVKMTFVHENIAGFERLFREHKRKIRSFEGCTFLELYQDKNDPCTFFTYSHWENEENLTKYRHSPFFRSLWAKSKSLFSKKPEAWSLEKV